MPSETIQISTTAAGISQSFIFLYFHIFLVELHICPSNFGYSTFCRHGFGNCWSYSFWCCHNALEVSCMKGELWRRRYVKGECYDVVVLWKYHVWRVNCDDVVLWRVNCDQIYVNDGWWGSLCYGEIYVNDECDDVVLLNIPHRTPWVTKNCDTTSNYEIAMKTILLRLFQSMRDDVVGKRVILIVCINGEDWRRRR